jgi:hypothetical protein
MSANVDNSSEIKSRYLYVTDTAHVNNLNVDYHIQAYSLNSGNVTSGEYYITNASGNHRVIDNNTDTFARTANVADLTATGTVQAYGLRCNNIMSTEFFITNATGNHRVIDNNTDLFARNATVENLTTTGTVAINSGQFDYLNFRTIRNFDGWVVIRSGWNGAGSGTGNIVFSGARGLNNVYKGFQDVPRVVATINVNSSSSIFVVNIYNITTLGFSYRKWVVHMTGGAGWGLAADEDFEWIATAIDG